MAPRYRSSHLVNSGISVPDGRRVVFQLWDWADNGRQYRNTQFLIKQTDDGYEVKPFETELRALLRDEILHAVEAAGYEDVRWHIPEESGYYQPIVTAFNTEVAARSRSHG